MKELIKIQETEKGQIVSAKELYSFLGYNSSHWKRWSKRNLVSSDFFDENKDYVTLAHRANGNESFDFALTLDTAKEIAMMSRTKKGKKARNYFLECEKKLNTCSTFKVPQTLSQALQLAANFQKDIEIKNRQLKNKDKEIEIETEKRKIQQILAEREWEKIDREDLYR